MMIQSNGRPISVTGGGFGAWSAYRQSGEERFHVMTAPMKRGRIALATAFPEQFAPGHSGTHGGPEVFEPVTRPAPEAQYPRAAQFDFRVEDDLVDRVARKGEFLRCVDLHLSEIEVSDGDLVVIACRDSGKTRLLARRMHRLADRTIFSHDSVEERYATGPIVASSTDRRDAPVRVVAKALYAWCRIAD